ncbi:MAG TPA: DUF5681 domain-containing protein [Nitrospira sp.]|nr:DUF5681 domain-containing protein [Nitrospira sp.]
MQDTTTRRTDAAAAGTAGSDREYKVGPGRPPREYQFKPGQSGNPKGAKRKHPAIALDLKAAFEQALNTKVTLKQGDKERLVTMAVAGIKQLVAQFATGDRHARRDLIALAPKLGVDLMAGHQQTIEEALTADHAAILRAYVQRQNNKTHATTPVIAPPELLDDDLDDPTEN